MDNMNNDGNKDNILFFLKEVAKYFMDFLETDFHKRKYPRRSIKFRNADNLLVGINLEKYPLFSDHIKKLYSQAFDPSSLQKITKGTYHTSVPENLLELIRYQIDKVSQEQITDILHIVTDELSKGALLYKDEHDKALEHVNDAIEESIRKILVQPLIHNLEKPLENLEIGDENSVYLMEEELTKVLNLIDESAINKLIVRKLSEENIDAEEELKEIFSLDLVKEKMTNFFQDYEVTDLFSQLFELEKNRNILDKQEFYLYLGDITHNKIKYPIFYIPFQLTQDDNSFKVEFSSQLYINKKALEYIAQEYNETEKKQGTLKEINERIIYLAQHSDDLTTKLNSILNELTNYFQLDFLINLTMPQLQVSKSAFTRISNNFYISLFDKSDEALINDYEEILNLDLNSELLQGFAVLLDDFIFNNPVSVNVQIENEWADLDTSEKLTYTSPIPLNSEQIKILTSLKKDDCKYVIVEGPPGTGKSHTITAVVFNAILENKSVLVLSDKKEALDVVEKNISDTLDKVRVGDNFRNPILRLGKTGNTYDQILSMATIKKLEEHYRAVRNNYENLSSSIDRSINSLKDDINAEIYTYDQVDISQIKEFYNLENYLIQIPSLSEVINAEYAHDITQELLELRRIILLLKDISSKYQFDFTFNIPIDNQLSIEFKNALDLLKEIIKDKELVPIDYDWEQNINRINSLDIDRNALKGVIGRFLSYQEFLTQNSALLDVLEVSSSLMGSFSDIQNDLSSIIVLNNLVNKLNDVYPDYLQTISIFNRLEESSLTILDDLLDKYDALRLPIIGFFGKNQKLHNLDIEFKKLFDVNLKEPHQQLNTIDASFEIAKYAVELYKKDTSQSHQNFDVLKRLLAFAKNPSLVTELNQLSDLSEHLLKEITTLSNENWCNKLEIDSYYSIVLVDICINYLKDSSAFYGFYVQYKYLLSEYLTLNNDEFHKNINVDALVNMGNILNDYYSFINELSNIKQEDIEYMKLTLSEYTSLIKTPHIEAISLKTIINYPLAEYSDSDFEKIIRYLTLKQLLTDTFSTIPEINYSDAKGDIEQLVTTQMTYILDSRVLEFWEKYRNDAMAIRDVIRSKSKFDKTQFYKLKEAFPCVIAGIRDYAEFIPLEPNLFDLVIIDEASQVSIAQAFPALLRAKQVLVLGDKLQFANIKSALARTDINTEYINNLRNSFTAHISTESSKMVKLNKFNIKTSILDFFEFINNYQTRLVKHFRGYKELIDYSNRFFYNSSLQVMKIRGKTIDEVLQFGFVEHDGKKELKDKTNIPEAEYIVAHLKELKELGSKVTVGIITPHTEQQRLLVNMINDSSEAIYFNETLKLKIMTFDTCQGEERDIIYYSMVATETDDKLMYIFPKDVNVISDGEETDGNIRRQRLNVGFSRARECMHFVLSKDLDKYSGAIGEALRYYWTLREEAKSEVSIDQVDQNSPMEKQVINWLYQTDFWKTKKERITVLPQFDIGAYLKQLDLSYNHPKYKVDFLIVYKDEGGQDINIIIEYDGFRDHFKDDSGINSTNYQYYYNDQDLYRQKVLESYGYKFIRINKFNSGNNPIETLNNRIDSLLKKNSNDNTILIDIKQTVQGLQDGSMKECPKCKGVKNQNEFYDATLKTNYGRFCKSCKNEFKTINSDQFNAKDSPSPSDKLCPTCGNKMWLRTGKYGKFFGCSRFPYCKGTRQYH